MTFIGLIIIQFVWCRVSRKRARSRTVSPQGGQATGDTGRVLAGCTHDLCMPQGAGQAEGQRATLGRT